MWDRLQIFKPGKTQNTESNTQNKLTIIEFGNTPNTVKIIKKEQNSDQPPSALLQEAEEGELPDDGRPLEALQERVADVGEVTHSAPAHPNRTGPGDAMTFTYEFHLRPDSLIEIGGIIFSIAIS